MFFVRCGLLFLLLPVEYSYGQESYAEYGDGIKDYAYTVYTKDFAEKYNLPQENVVELTYGVDAMEFQHVNLPYERLDRRVDNCFINMLINPEKLNISALDPVKPPIYGPLPKLVVNAQTQGYGERSGVAAE